MPLKTVKSIDGTKVYYICKHSLDYVREQNFPEHYATFCLPSMRSISKICPDCDDNPDKQEVG